jgi:hypothetical protein
VNGPYNYTADANIGNWPLVIRAAQRLDVSYVLPGHGESGGKDLLEGQAQFMLNLHRAVDTAIKSGKKLEGLTVTLPDSVKNWNGKSLKAQIKDTYEEITQKKPHGDLPH